MPEPGIEVCVWELDIIYDKLVCWYELQVSCYDCHVAHAGEWIVVYLILCLIGDSITLHVGCGWVVVVPIDVESSVGDGDEAAAAFDCGVGVPSVDALISDDIGRYGERIVDVSGRRGCLA